MLFLECNKCTKKKVNSITIIIKIEESKCIKYGSFWNIWNVQSNRQILKQFFRYVKEIQYT